MKRRIERLNSLLKEVISDVIRREVRNPHIPQLISITRVDVTRDLHQAKVYVSVIGEEMVRKRAIDALQSAAGFIAVYASKEVSIRYFPQLTFLLDDTVDLQLHIAQIIEKIEKERERRDGT
jgi:ribosome-binding factor A